MRILVSTEALGGGVFEAVHDQIAHRIALGDEVTLMYARRPETPESTAWPSELRLVEIPWGSRPSTRDLAALRRFRREIRVGVDLIHLHSSKAGAIGRIAAIGSGVPVAFSPHAYAHLRRDISLFERRSFNAIERRLAPITSRVLAVSGDEYTESLYLGHHSPRLVRNGVADRGVAHAGGRYISTVGRVTAQRSPHETAHALKEIARRTDRTPLWVGTGEDAHIVEAAGVEVTGWVSRDEAVGLLQESAAYIHWSAWDGLSLSLLDAMMSSVAIGASDIGPNREALGGVVPTFHDVHRMTEWLSDLINDGRADDVGVQLRERALDMFSERRMLEALDRCYEELVGR